MKKEFHQEHEKQRNNLLLDIANQHDTDNTERVKELREKHACEVKKLKQSFCEKLEKISEMKKKWMEEEETKRIKMQVC